MKLFKEKEKIIEWLEMFKIKNYEIIENEQYGYVVDVFEDVNLSGKNLSTIKIKFNHIRGSFDCSTNTLKTLLGCPSSIRDSFICANNNLDSLEHGPKIVGGSFNCVRNQLKSLKYCPMVGKDLHCSHNLLVSLNGSPKEINGNFDCSYNHLANLKNVPEKISESFICNNNQLETFVHFPKHIGKYVNFTNNRLLGKFQNSYNLDLKDYYQQHKNEMILKTKENIEKKLQIVEVQTTNPLKNKI